MRISDWSSDVCSSDLSGVTPATPASLPNARLSTPCRIEPNQVGRDPAGHGSIGALAYADRATVPASRKGGREAPLSRRSEEHTSELQSLMRISYAVFCLKKQTHSTQTNTTTHHHDQTTINTL